MLTLDVTLDLPGVERAARDIARAGQVLTDTEARYLVDLYYQVQDYRKAAGNQTKALEKLGEPNRFVAYTHEQMAVIEGQIKRALDQYTDAHVIGIWSRSIVGIGPVIAAGLMAHIDIHKAPTVGHIWRFAGLDPTTSWGKGQKRPWNADLKVLCWKIGESFNKVQNNERDVYGKVLVQRKQYEQAKNEAGDYAEQAAHILASKKIGKDTVAYASYIQGKLPDGHIHARAKRYATKLFLAHWHHVAYESELGTPPPLPYILTQPGHVHFIAPPNWENGEIVLP